MSGIRLTWDIGGFNPEKHYIYRSASPISPSNLPTPIAEVGQGINQYNDLTITDGETYHYFVAAEKMGLLCPAGVSLGVLASFGVGPQTLIAGDSITGFFGEVPSVDLITGNALQADIGLTSPYGVSQASDDPWLKFIIDGKIIFVAKRPYIYNIVKQYIDDAGASTGELLKNIDGYTYKVRLLGGADKNPTSLSTGYTGELLDTSEWNRTILNVLSGYTNFDLYNTTELGLDGNGRGSWCFEQSSSTSSGYVVRGNSSPDDFLVYSSTNTSSNLKSLGWRPVLELV